MVNYINKQFGTFFARELNKDMCHPMDGNSYESPIERSHLNRDTQRGSGLPRRFPQYCSSAEPHSPLERASGDGRRRCSPDSNTMISSCRLPFSPWPVPSCRLHCLACDRHTLSRDCIGREMRRVNTLANRRSRHSTPRCGTRKQVATDRLYSVVATPCQDMYRRSNWRHRRLVRDRLV